MLVRWFRSGRVSWRIAGATVVSLAAIVGAALALIEGDRAGEIEQGQARLERLVSSAEASANRALLTVDLTLAGMNAVLAEQSRISGQLEPQALQRSLAHTVHQGLLITNLAVLDGQGRLLAAAKSSSARLGLSLPSGFAQQVLSQAVPTMTISEPSLSRSSGEWVTFMGRPVQLGRNETGLVIAEVSAADIGNILGQPVDESELEITLEPRFRS